MKDNKWARLVACATGLVNRELLPQNEHLAAAIAFCGRACRSDFGCLVSLRLSGPERSVLAEIGKRMGRKASVARVVCNRPGGRVQCRERFTAAKFAANRASVYARV
jgi:hypothetical protein